MNHFSILLALLMVLTLPASASEFRDINRINRKGAVPAGAQEVETLKMVDRALVRQAVEKIMASWNTPQLEKYLGEKFHNKERLMDTISTFAQRDAKVTVLAIQNLNTLQQFTDGSNIVSRVSVIARTQIQFTDPNLAAKTADGTVEYILKITQPIKKGAI
ncbi:MAG: hypothetical protein SFW65_04955 [Alphaproteobacteria bacterium]|nr:hypothetical protein [Alphaproteobacteria bacterium]